MSGPLLRDRVKETSTTTGTGTFNLAGTLTRYRTFVAAVGTGNTCYYCIQHDSADEWEVGIGTVTDSSPDTLSRTTILASSNAGAAVNFSAGDKTVFLTLPAEMIIPVSFLRGHKYGMELSRNVSDPTNDIDISPGGRIDTAGAKILSTDSVWTKRLDATWVAGSGNGGMADGLTITALTWYHVFVFDTAAGGVDFGFDTSFTAANLLATSGVGTRFKRLGSIFAVSNGDISPFSQDGDEFLWIAGPLDVDVTNQSTTAVLRTLMVPPDVKVQAIINTIVNAASARNVWLSPPDLTDQAPSITAAPLCTVRCGANLVGNSGPIHIRTDTSRQIRSRADGASTTLRITTLGWIDPR